MSEEKSLNSSEGLGVGDTRGAGEKSLVTQVSSLKRLMIFSMLRNPIKMN